MTLVAQQRAQQRCDAIRYRLSPSRRHELTSAISTSQIRTLGPAHLQLAIFRRSAPYYTDKQIVHIAKAHGIRRWRLLRERLQGLRVSHVGEVILTQWLCLQAGRCPWRLLRALLTLTTALYADWRMRHAARTCFCPYVDLHRWPQATAAVTGWRLGPAPETAWRWGLRGALAAISIAATVYDAHAHPGLGMATLSVNTVWELRTAGNDTNGGGYVTGSATTDYSQQDNANSGASDTSTTDAVANGTTTITSGTANFTTGLPGNILYFQGGTGAIAAVWRQCATRTNATTITLDAAIAASTGMTMNIGGALATPGKLGSLLNTVAGHLAYVKSGTYTITSASTDIPGGCLLLSTGVSITIEGYGSTRGDLGTKPLWQASGISTFTICRMEGTRDILNNLEVDGAGLTSSRGVQIQGFALNCTADNCTNTGFTGESSTSAAAMFNCAATGCSTAAAINGLARGQFNCDCVAYSNTFVGFGSSTQGTTYVRCIAAGNTGATTDGFQSGASEFACVNCVAYANGRHGFNNTDSGTFRNCIAEGQTSGNGFTSSTGNADYTILLNCAGFNNLANTSFTGTAPTYTLNAGFITLTASPFTNAGSGDFSLNNTAGGGAACRAAGFPGTLQYGGTGYLDVGALQSQAGSAASPRGVPFVGAFT